MKNLTFDNVRNNSEIQTYLRFSGIDPIENVEGDWDGESHALYCAKVAEKIMKLLGYSEKEQELAKIAGYLHDIGHVVGKNQHEHNGGLMFLNILKMESYDEDIYSIVSAIGCHESTSSRPVSPIAAALVLGDKTDLRHERFKKKEPNKYASVLLACKQFNVVVNKENMTIGLWLTIDTEVCSVMDYFEIFMERTLQCQRACHVLNCNFELYINKDKFL